jgi:hypothetical protein
MFAGVDLLEATTVAVILPALVMILINAPRFLREALMLYREYRKSSTTTDPNRDSDQSGS